MRLRIGELSPTEEQIITVTFEGTQETEEEMAIELTWGDFTRVTN